MKPSERAYLDTLNDSQKRNPVQDGHPQNKAPIQVPQGDEQRDRGSCDPPFLSLNATPLTQRLTKNEGNHPNVATIWMEARDGDVPSLTNLAGPLLIGALFSYFLYGAFFVQSVHYFQTNKFSRTHIRSLILVAFVSLVELASVIGVTGNVYHILCKLIPRGDFSFQAPPMAMLLAVYLSLGGFPIPVPSFFCTV
ncbi:hypothetical protein NMY22_g19072 [Coprinellus aureogranulatus]|nr:hypothetical protein NMY22_g19072 [Coprinellus aureogranulatus]